MGAGPSSEMGHRRNGSGTTHPISVGDYAEVNEPSWRGEGGPISSVATVVGSGSDYGTNVRSPPMPVRPPSVGGEMESPEELERVTTELHNRVENWHGLDLTRYVFLCSPHIY